MRLRPVDVERGVEHLVVSLPPQNELDVEMRTVRLPTLIVARSARRSFRLWWEPESSTLFWAETNPEPTPEDWLSIGFQVANIEYS